MRRWLFNIVAGFSLLALLATATVWIGSYFTTWGWVWSDGIRVPTAGYQIAWRKLIVLHRGGFYFIMDRTMGGRAQCPTRLEPATAQFAAFGITPQTPTAARRLIGFEYEAYNGYPDIASVAIGPPVELKRLWRIPLWALAVAAGPIPAWWLVNRLKQRRRTRLNCCVVCGYDLRATPDRCPECGNSKLDVNVE